MSSYDYNNLLVPYSMRGDKIGNLLVLLGSDIGKEYVYIKSLFNGVVDFIEVDMTVYTMNLGIVNSLRSKLNELNIQTQDFNDVILSTDYNINTVLVSTLRKYIINKGTITNIRVEYNNIIKLLMYLEQTFSVLDSSILNEKVVYYGGITNDIVEYFKFLNLLGVDVIYLSLDLGNESKFNGLSVNILRLGSTSEDIGNINTIVSSVDNFKTRTSVAVDRLVENELDYKIVVRKLENSIYDFNSLYNINVNSREYYNKDTVNKIIYLPVYLCNIIGYDDNTYIEVLDVTLNTDGTFCIDNVKDIVKTLDKDLMLYLDSCIDYKNKSVNYNKVTTLIKGFSNYSSKNIDYILGVILNVLDTKGINYFASEGKLLLLGIFYSIVSLGVNLDLRDKLGKYVVNNYDNIVNSSKELRYILLCLSALGNDVVVFSANSEIDGLHNIKLSKGIYNDEDRAKVNKLIKSVKSSKKSSFIKTVLKVLLD